MASRNIVQQQNGGEAVPGGLKQKKMAAEGRNRRALGDIGNVATTRVVQGKPLPQVSRPVTRSFCAQLLANAQARTANGNIKVEINKNNQPNVTTKVKEPLVAVRKPLQKQPIVAKPKPAATVKPEEVVIANTDEIEAEKKKALNKKRASDVSARKQAPTLTATLTARSKAACGLSKKPKEQIVDIDAADIDNELAVVEYIEDMYKFYKLAESETRFHDYMDSQLEINARMRAILIDWLVEVHNKFELNPETFYLTINIVDRFLSKKPTSRRELQLVGLGAMLIASKYEEIWAPEVNDFVCISDRAYTHHQVLSMEKSILGELEWYLTVPTPYVYLVRFIKASIPDPNVENMVYFLAELGMMNYETVAYCYSMIAASAVYAARITLNKTPAWTETLKLHTGFSEPQLIDCTNLLVSFHAVPDQKLRAIHRKYSSPEKGAVALLPPATLASTSSIIHS
ncbi:kinase activator [Lithospermum erythrorhizon]|uniref:Kinase activator n=1 Tax=Lithospermum erythrorhizon TaxID=34254 RepID=A0AAV3RNP2_LITER